MHTVESWLEKVRQATMLSVLGEWLASYDPRVGMPPGGGKVRGEDAGRFVAMRQEILTARSFTDMTAAIIAGDAADAERPRLVACAHAVKRASDRLTHVPADLLVAVEAAKASAEAAFDALHEEGGSADALLEKLGTVVGLMREQGQALAEGLGSATPYDALMGEFEPGLTGKHFQSILDGMLPDLTVLVDQICEATDLSQPNPIASLPSDQRVIDFALAVARGYGLDPNRTRVDRTVHPMCAPVSTGEVRIAVRHTQLGFADAVLSTLHEAGHGVYELGMDPAWERTPLAQAASYGTHESISRFWEVIVGRMHRFWDAYKRELDFVVPEAASLTAERIWKGVNRVERSLIRTESDPLTYVLHIALRFNLEMALINGTLEVSDMPDAWHDEAERLLRVTSRVPKKSWAQDPHWAGGTFGYFPTYWTGQLMAATYQRHLKGDDGSSLARLVQDRRLTEISAWLRENVFRHGQEFTAPELIQRISGQPLSSEAFMEFARSRFVPMYEL